MDFKQHQLFKKKKSVALQAYNKEYVPLHDVCTSHITFQVAQMLQKK